MSTISIVKFTIKSILATSNFAWLFPLYFNVCNSISIFGIFNIYNVVVKMSDIAIVLFITSEF